ncbi:MAG: DUF6531 domain-containing protein, partial [Coriobacteriales bacterium]|nr:DUF6531 domain-containing protein [Coriobacteriales bacterium]
MYHNALVSQLSGNTNSLHATADQANTVCNAIQSVISDTSLQGAGYDAMRTRFSSCDLPLAQGYSAFCSNMARVCMVHVAYASSLSSFPEPASTDDIQQQINQLQDHIYQWEQQFDSYRSTLGDTLGTIAADFMDLLAAHIDQTRSVISSLNDKLRQLYEYDSDTSALYDDINDAASALERGARYTSGLIWDGTGWLPTVDANDTSWQTDLATANANADSSIQSCINAMYDNPDIGPFMQAAASALDPVSTVSGNFSYSKDLLGAYGTSRMPYALFYNSMSYRTSHIGRGWSDVLSYKVIHTRTHISLVHPAGDEHLFLPTKKGPYENISGPRETVDVTPGEGAGRRYIYNRCDGATLSFNVEGALTDILYTDGVQVHIAYEHRHPIRVLKDGAVYLSFEYDKSSMLCGVNDSHGRHVSFENTGGRLMRVCDVCGNATAYSYDANGFLASIQDAYGNELLENTYDDMGRVVAQKAAGGIRAKCAYDGDAKEALISKADKSTVKYVHDAAGRTTSIEERSATGDVAREAFEYNDRYLCTRHIDKRGGASVFAYDDAGRMLSSIDAFGTRKGFAYDEAGNLTSYSKDGICIARCEYEDGRPVRVTGADGTQTRITYDDAGRPVSIEAGDKACAARADMSYDDEGRLSVISDARGGATYVEHDSLGRISKITDATGSARSYSYDAAGRITNATDPLGDVASFSYDCRGRMARALRGGKPYLEYAYDAQGNIASVTDAAGNADAYEYDESGRMSAYIDKCGNKTRYEYDARGRLARAT